MSRGERRWLITIVLIAVAVVIVRDEGMPRDLGSPTTVAIAIAILVVAGLFALRAMRRRRRSRY